MTKERAFLTVPMGQPMSYGPGCRSARRRPATQSPFPSLFLLGRATQIRGRQQQRLEDHRQGDRRSPFEKVPLTCSHLIEEASNHLSALVPRSSMWCLRSTPGSGHRLLDGPRDPAILQTWPPRSSSRSPRPRILETLAGQDRSRPIVVTNPHQGE